MAKPTMSELMAMTPEDQWTNLKQYGTRVRIQDDSYYDKSYIYSFDTVVFTVNVRLGKAVSTLVDQGKVYITFPTLTITAEDKSKVTGQANPTLTVSYAGFVEGDTSASLVTAPTIVTTAVLNSPEGTYPITASGAAHPKYNIVYVAGTLTVTAS